MCKNIVYEYLLEIEFSIHSREFLKKKLDHQIQQFRWLHHFFFTYTQAYSTPFIY
jgi:hypothetical protein